MKHLIYSALVTPDGTVLESKHRHDYVSHKDKNGETYFIDGGLSYIRSSVNKEAATSLAEYWDDEDPESFLKARKIFTWGTFGKDGNQPRTYKPLNSLETEHIEAIIRTQYIQDWMRDLFQRELEYRNERA